MRRYFVGQIVSTLGSWIQVITLNLLAWQLTHSAALLGGLNFLLLGPIAVFAPLAGSRIQPHNARRVTVWMVAGAAAVSLMLLALFSVGALTAPLIVVLSAVSGVLFGMELPARQVFLASCVRERQRIGNAVSMNTLAINGARMVGPAIAAWSFDAYGAAPGFAVAGLASLVMLGCMLGPLMAIPESTNSGGGKPSLRAALSYAMRDRVARLFLPALAGMAVLAGSFHTLVPVLADDVFGNAARWTGIFLSSAGLGALAAAATLSSSLAVGATRRLSVVTPWAVATALLGIGTASAPQLVAASFAIVGFGVAFVGPGTIALLQQHAPVQLRGALAGLYIMCHIGLLPVGYLAAGSIAQALGVQSAFMVLGLLLAALLLVLFVPRWRMHGRVVWDGDRI